MRTSEWVAVAYFAYLIATAIVLRAPRRRTRGVLALALATAALIALAGRLESARGTSVLRDWLPGAYIMLGYWATGLLYRGPNGALEARLDAVDRRLFAHLGPLVLRAPRPLLELFELAYLLCYPMVPAGLAALYLTGQRSRADAFWTLVLTAAFAAYGVLPWAGTRPPRSLCSEMWITRRKVALHALNVRVLDRGSIQVNTFPSGHAASSWATALFLMTAPGGAWAVFTLVAAGIAAGAIIGRYHYAVDVGAGIAVALVARLVAGV